MESLQEAQASPKLRYMNVMPKPGLRMPSRDKARSPRLYLGETVRLGHSVISGLSIMLADSIGEYFTSSDLSVRDHAQT